MRYVFHKLKPLKEIEPGWWSLEWRPIKNGTWNLYTSRGHKGWRKFSIEKHDSSVHNGWGRSWDGFAIRICLYFLEINFWVHYNFICMKDGACDERPEKPLDFSLK